MFIYRWCLTTLLHEEGTMTTCKVELLGQCHSLCHQISNWHEIQSVYMPGVAQLPNHQPLDSTSAANLEDEVLYLPSSVHLNNCPSYCVPGLPDIESCLCLGQADNTLNEVHHQLCITSSIIQFKQGHHQASQQLS